MGKKTSMTIENNGSITEAIKQVIDNQLKRGITITEILEKQNSVPYVDTYNMHIHEFNQTLFFDEPKSKYHK